MSDIPPISVSGLASGMDTASIIKQLMAIERQGLTRLENHKSQLQQQQSAWNEVNGKLETLLDAARALSTPAKIATKSAVSSDEAVLTAAATSYAAVGNYAVDVDQLSEATVLEGNTDVGLEVNVNAPLNDGASLGPSVHYGTFTINGQQLEVKTTDTLQTLLDRINTLGGIIADYDDTTDTVTIDSIDSLILGSGSDTSNIFDMLHLSTDGVETSAESSRPLGLLVRSEALNAGGANGARSRVPVTGDASGKGEFTVNGVSITYDVNTDSINDVLSRINNSDAGVTAGYDSLTDSISLTNDEGGVIGLYTADVTGNFIAAFGLDNDPTMGQQAAISINGGDLLYSNDDIFTPAETGLTGLTLTAKQDLSSANVTVSADSSDLEELAQNFVTAYNDTMDLIEKYGNASGTKDKPQPGILQGDQFLSSLKVRLRSMLTAPASGLPAGLNYLGGIGISTSGVSPHLSLNTSDLQAAVASDPEAVVSLLSDADVGVVFGLKEYLQAQTGFGTGPIGAKADRLNNDIGHVDDAIDRFNRQLDIKEQQLRKQFTAMETMISSFNSGLSMLFSQLGMPQASSPSPSSSSSSGLGA